MTELLPGVDTPVRDISKSQWFTPPALAMELVHWAVMPAPSAMYAATSWRALEPSAGIGSIALPLRSRVRTVTCIEVDPANARRLESHGFAVACMDFLEFYPGDGTYNLCVMNPPFERGQAEAHILHALKFCDRVVCHCPLTTLEGIKRKAALWDKVQLHRMVIHSARPKYGAKGGATAMMTIDVTLGHTGAPTQMEWWT